MSLRCYYANLFRTMCLANFGEIRATKLAIWAILDLATLVVSAPLLVCGGEMRWNLVLHEDRS